MVEFPDQVGVAAAQAYQGWAESSNLSEEEKNKKFSRPVRVRARYLQGLRKELRSGDLTWYSDAPKVVGGMGEHAGALQHFIAGLPLCQLTHYAERASVWGLKVDDLEIDAVGRFIAMPGKGFESVEYEVRINSPESPERIKELATAAAHDCYVTNTLKGSCRVSGKVVLNGGHLMNL